MSSTPNPGARRHFPRAWRLWGWGVVVSMVLPLSLLAANVTVNATNKISLVAWQTVFVTNPPVTPFNWADTGPTNVPMRFYRAVLGPPWP